MQATHVHLAGQINKLQHRDVTEEDRHCDGAVYGPCHKITNVSHLLCANHESQGLWYNTQKGKGLGVAGKILLLTITGPIFGTQGVSRGVPA